MYPFFYLRLANFTNPFFSVYMVPEVGPPV